MPLLCPAAYLRRPGDWPALAEAAARRGWPVPVIYCDGPGMAAGAGLAHGRLQAAVSRGCHDSLLMPLPGMLGNPQWLMGLLRLCTCHGVTVSFVLTCLAPTRWADPGWPAPQGGSIGVPPDAPSPDTLSPGARRVRAADHRRIGTAAAEYGPGRSR